MTCWRLIRLMAARFFRPLLCLLLAWLATPLLAEEDVLFGSTASGQLKGLVEFTPPLELPVSVFPGIPGYATGAVGFHSNILDEPDNDFFQLSTAADFCFILLAKDAGMEVLNDHGSGYMTNGETFYIGPPPFDTHPVWDLVSGTPGKAYSLTLKIHDFNGVYPDSDAFVMSFTPTPLVGFGPYQLNLRLAPPLGATLWWPTNALGWTVESAASLTSASWVAVTNAPTVTGTNFFMDVSAVGPPQYFRLHKQ